MLTAMSFPWNPMKRAPAPVPDRQMYHLELMVTRSCSLRCSYCQVDRRQESMSPEIVRASVEFLFTAGAGDLELLFYGGEPLERFDLVRLAVELAEQRSAETGKRVSYILITNGLRLDQHVLRAFPADRLKVYLNLVAPMPARQAEGPGAVLPSEIRGRVTMLEAAGVWQCVNVVADPADLEPLRWALAALTQARVPRLQVFFRLGAEWPEEAAAAFLDEIGRLVAGPDVPRFLNAEERMAPFLLHNDAVVDCDGSLHWSAAIWLEQGFPELMQSCRIGHVRETASFDEVWAEPDDIRRILLETYPPQSPQGRILHNNVALADRFCRVCAASPAGSPPPPAMSPNSGHPERRAFFLCSTEAGCPVNLSFTIQFHNYITENEWSFRDVESSDTIVIVNCSTLPEYRRRVPLTVEYLAKRYPSKTILVTGCFVKHDVVEADNVIYVKMSRKDDFDALFGATVRFKDVSPISTAEADTKVRALDAAKKGGVPYNISIATGCTNNCSFCIQKTIFTTIESVPIDAVISGLLDGIEKGYTNFVIGGADISSYGHDLGIDVTDLFEALFTRVLRANPRLSIGFWAFEPRGLLKHFEELKAYFAEGLINWVRIPVQSGSDSVLKSMNRKYKIRDVLDAINELRILSPAMRIDTDLLFCYPTETEVDFEASLGIIDYFDATSLIVFGRHENTRAFAMQDVFSADEKARRCEVLESIRAKQTAGKESQASQGIEIQLPSAQGASRFFVLQESDLQRPALQTPRPPEAPRPEEVGAAPAPDDADTARLRRVGELLAGKGIELQWAEGRLDLVFPDDGQPDGTSCVSVSRVSDGANVYGKSGALGVWHSGSLLTPRISRVLSGVLQQLERLRSEAPD
jgi:tRNA A37 methylthiotransferase MiaB